MRSRRWRYGTRAAAACRASWLSFSFARRLTYHPSQKMQRSGFYGNCLNDGRGEVDMNADGRWG